MQMKKNKVLLLGGTVLFSVMGGIEKANSAELDNAMNVPLELLGRDNFGLDCLNHEPIRKEELVLDYKENKAPRMDDEIKKRTEELLGGGKNIDIPDDGREYVVVNRLKKLRTDKDIDNELQVAVHLAEREKKVSLQYYNEDLRDYYEGESFSRNLAADLGLEGVPYVRPENKDKKLDNQEYVKEEQDESFRIEKSENNVDVNFQECKLGFIELKKEEEDKEQSEIIELNKIEINVQRNEENDSNINNEDQQDPKVQNTVNINLDMTKKAPDFFHEDEDSNDHETTMLREMLQYEGEDKNDNANQKIELKNEIDNANNIVTNEPNNDILGSSEKDPEFPANEMYERVTGRPVPEHIKAYQREIYNRYTKEDKHPGQSIVIEKSSQKTWFQTAVTTVKSGLQSAWSSVKRGFSFGWSKVKSVFKWK